MVVCVAMGCASESAKQTAQGSAAANDGTQAVEAVGSDSEVNEPFSPEVLYERFPSLHGLPEPQRVQVVAMLNTVPAPCVPCEESTIAVCVLDDKKGCLQKCSERGFQELRSGDPKYAQPRQVCRQPAR